MRKIDKTLKEVRLWTKKVAAKVSRMSREESVAYFNAAKDLFPTPRRRRAA